MTRQLRHDELGNCIKDYCLWENFKEIFEKAFSQNCELEGSDGQSHSKVSSKKLARMALYSPHNPVVGSACAPSGFRSQLDFWSEGHPPRSDLHGLYQL